jgi:mono/diheme cytochrome c family protein
MKRLPALTLLIFTAGMLLGAADGSWLRRVPESARGRTNPLPDQQAAAQAGLHLYANECARCHGDYAQGKGSRPPLVSERVARATDGELAWLLRNGNSWKGMHSWSSLPDAERWQLVAYLRSLNRPEREPNVGAAQAERR